MARLKQSGCHPARKVLSALLATQVMWAGVCVAASSTSAYTVEQRVHEYAIPAQSLRDALLTFSKQSGIQVIIATESVSKHRSSALIGAMTPGKALDLLLQGRSLEYVFTGENTVTIRDNKPDEADKLQKARAKSSSLDRGNDAASGLTLEEVIVSAQRREEKLQDVPISITAISGTQLESRGIEGNGSLSGLAPNLQINKSPSSSLISQISIRGSGTSQAGIYVDPAVGMYVDGVYIAKSQGNMFELLDLERVEVLRGPQGTLFGRNTLGGAISFVTRKPAGEWSGLVSLDVGNYGRHVERISVDLPRMGIASLGLALRNEMADGWMRNENGRALGSADRQSFRMSANFDVSNALKVNYAYDFTDVNETTSPSPLYSLSGSGGTLAGLGNTLVSTGTRLGRPAYVASGNFLIAAANQMVGYAATERPTSMAIDTGHENYQRLRINGNALTAAYSLDERNTLKYIGSYRVMAYSDRLDLDGSPVKVVSTGRDTNLKSYSHEFQWVGSQDRFNYAAGLYLYKEDGLTSAAQLLALSLPPADNKYLSFRTTDNAKAVFGQVDYRVTDALMLTAGIRRTNEERTNASAQFGSAGYNGPITSVLVPMTSASASFNATTPTLAASYKFNEGLTFYGRMAKGFRAGGFSGEAPSVVGVSTPVNPERSTTYEFGFKASLADGKAQVNAALFRNKITDMQLSRLLLGTTSSVLTNAGRATMDGLEIEGALLIADGWKVQGGYGYLRSRFDEYLDYPYNAATAAAAGVSTSTLINTAGNRVFPSAPRHTLSLSLDGRLTKTAWGTLRGVVDYTYTGNFYNSASNKSLTAPDAGAGSLSGFTHISSLRVVNARLLMSGIPIGGPGVASASIWVRNLTDTKNLVNKIDFSYYQVAAWMPPRTLGVSLNYKW